jgi:hypothetical protein
MPNSQERVKIAVLTTRTLPSRWLTGHYWRGEPPSRCLTTTSPIRTPSLHGSLRHARAHAAHACDHLAPAQTASDRIDGFRECIHRVEAATERGIEVVHTGYSSTPQSR